MTGEGNLLHIPMGGKFNKGKQKEKKSEVIVMV